jgi:UDP-N-acetylglucosamine 2-epimerase (non-hydrolysing)
MSAIFFEEFGLPYPNPNLGVGPGSHAQQTAKIMQGLEPILESQMPDWLVVVGDVNSTLAAALVASKLSIRTAHVEAGLRSRDRSMPEEINRVVTDQIADLLLTPSRDADENLINEGIDPSRVVFVGNVMIDTLARLLPRAKSRWPRIKAESNLEDRFALVTLHRPSNVDSTDNLQSLMTSLEQLSELLPVVFPVHPRTLQRIEEFGIELPTGAAVRLLDPLGYLDFMAFLAHASLVLTDSGGIQEETTYLGVPCLTARPNTERPITLAEGTNQLVESRSDKIMTVAERLLSKDHERKPAITNRQLEFWDGRAAQRIVAELLSRAKMT